jgi:hypothetical protein
LHNRSDRLMPRLSATNRVVVFSLACILLALADAQVSAASTVTAPRKIVAALPELYLISDDKINPSNDKSDSKTTNSSSDKTTNLVIIVGGRTLTGPLSSSQQLGGRTLLPIVGIARALGDTVAVNASARTVEVHRQTGVIADFNAQLNQIRENGAVILAVSNTADIVFPPNPDELMLPVEIVSALLDVSVRVDDTAQAVRITRGQPKTETLVGAQRAAFELYQIEYDYNFNRYSSSASQALMLRSSGRIGNGRFSLVTNSSGGSGASASVLRNATFTYERPNGQSFIAGDFGTGSDLLFLSSTVRGAWGQLPFNNLRITAFAGRAVSGVVPLPALLQPLESAETQTQFQPHRLRYDTNIFGAYATYDSSRGTSSHPSTFQLSTGALRFSGAQRSGTMITSNIKYTTHRSRLQGDVAIGSFSGTQFDNTRVKGFGVAADVSESFNVSNNLTLQGRYSYTSPNFLTPQAGAFAPLKIFAGGVTWRPQQWLSTSLSVSNSSRTDSSKQSARVVSTTVSITPRHSWPTIFFSHTQSSATPLANSAYTLLNASKDFRRYRLFVNATRIKSFGPAFLNTQLGADLRLGEYGTLQVTQSIGNCGAIGGSADWQTQNLLKKSISMSAGFSYNRTAASPLTITERVSAALRLPRQNTLQLSYLNTQTGPTLLLSLHGTLLRGRRAEMAAGAPIGELNSYGAFYGRVYEDVNLNGRFEPGVDRPLSNVKVRVDGNRDVISDDNGQFRMDGVKIGEHQINLDLLSVRADLTLLDTAQQTATLLSKRDSIVDFRLVRTGRMTGMVWVDANNNGKFDEGEQTLADVRVVSGSNRDTLTDANGVFILADLPPGEHVVLIDEKTLPEKMRSATGSLTIKVLAGSETGNVNLPVIPAAPEVKRFPWQAN